MSPVRKADVIISSMVTMDMDMVILLGAMLCSIVVGLSIAVVAYYCLVKKRKKARSTAARSMTSPKDISNSYIHYGSPGNSVRPMRKSKKTSSKRKASEFSVYSDTSNGSLSGIVDKFKNSFREDDSLPYTELNKNDDDFAKEEELLSTGGKVLNFSQGLNTCQNLSSNLSDGLGLTGSSLLSPTALQITASTSLCEQCLSPPPSPPPLLGTSVSLPPTTVEMTKTVLGMTMTASDHPVVCDTCLSPSKLGDTTRSLNLPLLGFGNDLRQRKISPSGIMTNPRMKNPMLSTLRETMNHDLLATLANIDIEDKVDFSEGRELVENSFDSLLSPSKACEWLSADPFELSSDEGDIDDDPRMVKIQPKIKVKSARSSDGSRSEDKKPFPHFDDKILPQISSCHGEVVSSQNCSSPPARNQSALPVHTTISPAVSKRADGFSSPSLRSKDVFKPSSRMVPVHYSLTPIEYRKQFPTTPKQIQQQTPMTPPLYSPLVVNPYPIVLPPSPYQSPILKKDSLSSIVSIKNSKSSRTSVTITPNKPPIYFQYPPPDPGTAIATSHQAQESPNVAAIIRKQSSSSVTSTPILNPSTPIHFPKTKSELNLDLTSEEFLHEGVNDKLSNLAWDSTFEALKTLECSMKLEVTPLPLHKKSVDPYEDSPHDSNDSQLSACAVDKSCMSFMSLAWDNTGDMLAETDSPESLNSSMQSLDIDEIIGRVAPCLLQQDLATDSVGSPIMKLNPSFFPSIPSHASILESSSPYLKKSKTSIDMDALLDMDDDSDASVTSLKNSILLDITAVEEAKLGNESVQRVGQLLSFQSPCPQSPAGTVFIYPPCSSSTEVSQHEPQVPSSHSSHLQPPSHQMCRSGSSLLSTNRSQPSSPGSCEDFLSTCGSLDSWSTAYEL